MHLTSGWILVILGGMLLAGYLAQLVSHKVSVPHVTILLILGALLGPSVFDVIPESVSQWFPLVAHMALAMVGFLLGERFTLKEVRSRGRVVLGISVGEALITALLVAVAVYLFSGNLVLALILAGIAPASAPAAIFETVREGRAKGPLTRTLLGVVAIDDAWGVLIFSVLLVVAEAISGAGAHLTELGRGLWEVFGAVLVGGVIGFPMAFLTSRIRRGAPTLVEAMAFVFLTAGIATVLQVSYLLASMVLGAVVANTAKQYERPFSAIEGVSEPFFAIFFLLSGFRLEIGALRALGIVGAVYVVFRALGLIGGGWLAGRLVGAPPGVRRRIGFCILPQAGVALGFALLVREQLPEIGSQVLNLVIATTVLFEITGPLVAHWQLRRAGELNGAGEAGSGSHPEEE